MYKVAHSLHPISVIIRTNIIFCIAGFMRLTVYLLGTVGGGGEGVGGGCTLALDGAYLGFWAAVSIRVMFIKIAVLGKAHSVRSYRDIG
jgi:hypothetical protein